MTSNSIFVEKIKEPADTKQNAFARKSWDCMMYNPIRFDSIQSNPIQSDPNGSEFKIPFYKNKKNPSKNEENKW